MANKRDLLMQSNVMQRRGGTPSLDFLVNDMIGDSPLITDANALIPQANGHFVYKRFLMTPTGIEIPEDTTPEEWQDIGAVIKSLDSSISWIVGDWAVHANKQWGLTALQIAEMFSYEQSTIETYISVCTAIHGMIRNHTVSFGHHRLVAGLEVNQQQEYLQMAAKNNWTISQMRTAIKGNRPTLPLDRVGVFQSKLQNLRHEFKKSSDFERMQMITLLEATLEEMRRG